MKNVPRHGREKKGMLYYNVLLVIITFICVVSLS